MCLHSYKQQFTVAFFPLEKSQNFKNHDFLRFEKIAPFYLLQYLFGGFFRNISILTAIYIQFVCYLQFQKLKKDLENLFSSCHKVNFRKKKLFKNFFKKVDIISDAIIPIGTILKVFPPYYKVQPLVQTAHKLAQIPKRGFFLHF